MGSAAFELAARLRLPGQCAVCHGWCRGALCRDCVERHAPPLPRCRRCGLRLPPPATVCAACSATPPPFAAAFCALDYAFPWDRLIGRFKFEGEVGLAGALAPLLRRALPATVAPTLVLPVPLAPRRLAERGYNQAWELARRVAAAVGAAGDAQLLLRPVDGPHQAALPLAERHRNLRHAFLVEPLRRRALAGRQVALVDDVLTSGATAGAAARALLDAGAAAVEVWALARTPAPQA